MMNISTKQDERPSFQFYPADWIADLRGFSLEARGLWLELLLIMWRQAKRGYLIQANGQKHSSKSIANLLGIPELKIKKALQELENGNVFSLTDDKTIYCRRMVREWELRNKRAEAGQKGGIISSKLQAKVKQTAEEEVEEEVEKEEDKVLKYCFIILNTTEGYPINIPKDRELLIELRTEYPDIDFPRELKKWKAWLMDNPTKNYRLRLREWISHAKKYKDKAEENQKIIDQGKVEDKIQEEKGKKALHRNATPPEEALKHIGNIKKSLEKGGDIK